MREKRELNRVRDAAALVKRAVADGWKRRVGVDRQSDGGRVVTVVLEGHNVRFGGGGRIILLFFFRADGTQSLSAMSRFLEPRGRKRLGLRQAWTVFFCLENSLFGGAK